MQIISLALLGALSILVASTSPLVRSDVGRLLLVAAVSSTVLWLPTAEGMPVDCQFVDRLLSAFIGGSALYYLVGMALGPVPYRLMTNPPRALIEARRGAYRFDCAVALA